MGKKGDKDANLNKLCIYKDPPPYFSLSLSSDALHRLKSNFFCDQNYIIEPKLLQG